MEIRRLSRDEITHVYETHMTRDFPEDELKPLSAIEVMLEKGIYECLGLFEGDRLLSYAYFVTGPQNGCLLMDYLAVCPECRSGGYGGKFLGMMREFYSDRPAILLECESISTSPDEEQRIIRTRRISFYLKNNCRTTTVKSCLFGVEYEILCLPLKDQKPDAERELDVIYRLMFPDPVYQAHARIWTLNRKLLSVSGWNFEEQKLKPETSLFHSLHLDLELPRVIAFVGAGGKTTTMYQLADELAERGKRVLVTTSTHILVPTRGELFETDHWQPVLDREFTAPIVTVGKPAKEPGKLTMPDGFEDRELLSGLLERFDVLLYEADGAKGCPLKVPADYEPVLCPEPELVVAVAGLTAIGKTFEAGCFRMDTNGGWLHRSTADTVTPEDVALICMDQRGSRKGVGGTGTEEYRIVLNQADDGRRMEAANQIMPLLPDYLRYGCTVTSYERNEEE